MPSGAENGASCRRSTRRVSPPRRARTGSRGRCWARSVRGSPSAATRTGCSCGWPRYSPTDRGWELRGVADRSGRQASGLSSTRCWGSTRSTTRAGWPAACTRHRAAEESSTRMCGSSTTSSTTVRSRRTWPSRSRSAWRRSRVWFYNAGLYNGLPLDDRTVLDETLAERAHGTPPRERYIYPDCASVPEQSGVMICNRPSTISGGLRWIRLMRRASSTPTAAGL